MTTSKAYHPDAVALLPSPQKLVEKMVLFSPDLPMDQVVAPEFLTIQGGTVIPGDPGLVLTEDVYASVEWSKEGVLISSVLFDEEGYGWTYEEAWDDFLSSLRDRRDSLAKRAERLSPADQGVLDKLRRVIAPIS